MLPIVTYPEIKVLFEFFPLDFATLPLKGVRIKKKLTTALTRDIPAIFSLGAMAFYSENVA